MAENSDLETLLVKGAMAVIVFILGITMGSLPLVTGKVPVNLRDRILSICNSFAAGIFLAAGFIHLLSEGIDLFAAVYPDFHLMNLALLFAPLGFVVTFFIDKVIFLKDELEVHEHKIPAKNHAHSHSHSHEEEEEEEEYDDLQKHLGGVEEKPAHGHAHGMELSHEGKPTLSNYILVVVLSFHSILAGFVIGLETDLTVAITVFIALVSHHWIESFALGASILRSKVNRRPLLLLILFFSVMAPSGIILGMFGNYFISTETGEYIEAYLISFTAGSFIYVAVVDILIEEFTIARDKWWKLLTFLLGFICDGSIIVIVESASHAH